MVEIGKWYKSETLADDIDGYVYYFIYDDEPNNILCGVWFENGDHFETTEYSQLNGVEEVERHPNIAPILFNRDVIMDTFEGLYD